jgi:Reverse transcriptase (RNA-dependent DNA polymerase)
LEEVSLDSEDEERNFMTVSEEMVEPTSFHEAYHDKDPNHGNSWRNAIAKELENMEKCNVWSLLDRLSIPTNRKLIGSKWVFKEKQDGVFRARIVALGYSQVPGIDFAGNYLPVVNNTSFRILLLLIGKLGLKAWSLDVETAFLNGDLGKEMYMKLPKGFNGEDKGLSETKALKLNKSIYGLVQAAQQWNKRFEVFKLGFRKNNVDPCLFFKQEGDPFCVICLYVDDMIITGDEVMMNETIKGLEAVFKIKIQ